MAELLFKQKKSYPLLEVEQPQLFREQFPYAEVPRLLFEDETVPIAPAEDIWITDTTFRDGQQARAPYTVSQIVELYKLMNRLGGPNGVIRQSEFFIYSRRDREAIDECRALGFPFPEITAWIRANADELRKVKEMGLKETGILTSVSDYHIFLKLKKNRREIMEHYLSIVERAVEMNIRIRCHFEDVTRADIYGFCVPFAAELMKIYRESGVPVKIRLCDTMGFGVPYPQAVLPRSVPKLIQAMKNEAGVPDRLLEWHGHNDFHKVIVNATTAWISGCSAVNTSLLGIGERTGNTPLEAAIMDYISLKGYQDEIDTTAITEIAEFYRRELKYDIPTQQPFVGQDFNVTRAGIHADGMLKNEEIYNIFDTTLLLNRPPSVAITDKSGVAGIAQWINDYLKLEPRSRIDKRHPGIARIAEWIAEQYQDGRETVVSNEEMLDQAHANLSEYFEFDLKTIKKIAHDLIAGIISEYAESEDMVSMQRKKQETLLEGIFKKNKFVQLALVADRDGKKNTSIYVRTGVISKEQEKVLDKDYVKRAWFIVPIENNTLHITDMYKSKITGQLGVTVSAPIRKGDSPVGVLRLDCKFEDLVEESRRRMGGETGW